MKLSFSSSALLLSSLLLMLLLSSSTSVRADGHILPAATYRATITEIPGTNSGVTGTAIVFASKSGVVGYGGFIEGVEANLVADNCTAKNGCGVHIHEGKGCQDSDAQLGHYWNTTLLGTGDENDPWLNIRYSSDANGEMSFGGVVDIGSNDVEGRAFLVHAENGDRLGCGILERVPDKDLLVAETSPLGDGSVTAEATVYSPSSEVCMYGSAEQLEPNLVSYLQGGSDCTATNGCGVHIHSGTDCTDSTTQEGHYYSTSLYPTPDLDPWLPVGYRTTPSDTTTTGGTKTYFADCLVAGVSDNEGRAFLIHANDGSRSSCGILKSWADDNDDSEVSSSDDSSSPHGSSLSGWAMMMVVVSSSVSVISTSLWV